MIRAILIGFAVALIGGCWEADPDQDTMGELRDTVASFPPEVSDVMRRWAANRVAFGYVSQYQRDEFFGTVVCYDNDKPGNPLANQTHTYDIKDMLKCLNNNMTMTYAQCLAYMLTDFSDLYPDRDCEWSQFAKKLKPDEMPAETEVERVTIATMAHALLGPPPPVEIQLLLIGLPGMVGPAGALCIQVKRDWACAPAFGDEPGVTSSAASGGGDR